MKKLEFETSKGKFLLVDAIKKPNIHTGIKLSEITEEEASEIVDYSILKNMYASYNYGVCTNSYVYKSAIESLHSLLKSKGITDLSNKYIFKI